MVRGMTTRAVAIMRPMSKMVGALFSSNGVPSTATACMCVCVLGSGASVLQLTLIRVVIHSTHRLKDSRNPSTTHSPPIYRTRAPRALMGTDSGCSGSVASVWRRPMRSACCSPRPRMPPEQTEMPASRTLAMVCSRSSYVRVVITWASRGGEGRVCM